MANHPINVGLAARLFDDLGSWRLVAQAMPRENGALFCADALSAAVRRADKIGFYPRPGCASAELKPHRARPRDT